MLKLRCVRCGHKVREAEYVSSCPQSGGLLITRASDQLRKGRGSGVWIWGSGLFTSFMTPKITLGEGNTPLIKSVKIGKSTGLTLYFKDETKNPSGSFIDRGSATLATALKYFKVRSVVVPSTGDLSISVSTYLRRARISSKAYVPSSVTLSKAYKTLLVSDKVKFVDSYEEALAKALRVELRLNEEALKSIKEKYDVLKLPLTPERVKMAYMPEGGEVIPNNVGTAPGCMVRSGETLIISLPGVPRELESMWESYVEPKLRQLGVRRVFAERSFIVSGVPESSAAKIVKEILRKYDNTYIKTHPKGHEISAPLLEVYVQVFSDDLSTAEETADEVLEELKKGLESVGGVITRSEVR